MPILRPQYRITVGGISSGTGSSGAGNPLLDLDVRAALNAPANRCSVALEPGSGQSIEPGEVVTVELGSGEASELVYTGRVVACERGLHGIRVESLGSFASLAARSANLVFEKQNAGAIARELLKLGEVKPSVIEAGLTFPRYICSDARSLWSELRDLARRCAFLLYADKQDQAIFGKYSPKATHRFRYGVDLLELMEETVAPSLDGVDVYGESPTGQGQGSDAASWFTRKTVHGRAGKARGRLVRMADPAARSPDLARTVAANLLALRPATRRGRARVPGAPAVHLGDALQLEELPAGLDNSVYRVTGIRHRLNRRIGFVTDLAWESA